MDCDAAEIHQNFQTVDKPSRLALAFCAEADKSRSLALLLRHANSPRRAHEKSLDLLLKLQASRSDVAHGSSLGQATPDPPADSPAADVAQTPDPPFTKEPNPTIEHLIGIPVALTPFPAFGRTFSPKWNAC